MKNKNYTSKYMVKAVEMLKESQKSVGQLSKELGIGDSILSKTLGFYHQVWADRVPVRHSVRKGVFCVHGCD